MADNTTNAVKNINTLEKSIVSANAAMTTAQNAVKALAGAFGGSLASAVAQANQQLSIFSSNLSQMSQKAQSSGDVTSSVPEKISGAFESLTEVTGSIDGFLSTVDGIREKSISLMDFVNDVHVLRESFAGMAGLLTAEQQRIATFADNAKMMFGTLKTTLGTAASGIMAGFAALGGKIAPVISGIGTSFMALGTSFKMAMAPFLPAIAIFGAVAAAVLYLFNTNEEFRNSMMMCGEQLMAAILPILQQMALLFQTLMQALAPIVSLIAEVLAQVLTVIAGVILQIVTALTPLITMLVSALVPTITAVLEAIMPIIAAVISNLIPLIQTIVNLITTYVIPILSAIISTVASVISKIVEIVTPIITFIAGIIGKIVEVITTIIEKVAIIFGKVRETIQTVWNFIKEKIGMVIGGIIDVIGNVTAPVKAVFTSVKNIIVGVFDKIKGAWGGLTNFVGGIFGGIGDAIQTLVNTVKGFVNVVIKGINGAIGLINMIPGVEIDKIPYLAHGTDNWKGGFAYINEGGRGELTYLPNGSQVIPHDISVRYAKEAAKANTAAGSMDISGLGEYIAGAVIKGLSGIELNNTLNIDGRKVADSITPLVDRNMANKTAMRLRGAY